MKYFFVIAFFVCEICFSQIIDFTEKFILPNALQENSGLLFLGDKIITHNDSGDGPFLYELDSLTGAITRTITILNATNVDWEDITQSETHIFIGDIGNNVGNRNDLKIYKISKSDFLSSNQVDSEIISFSYEDQVDFSSQFNNHNFDAEALVYYENSLLLFTKNWVDFKTNVYKIPADTGVHTAEKVSTANVEGLITGATFDNGNFLLCGYETSFVSFLVHISFNRALGDDIFSSGFEKNLLTNELDLGSQIEGITSFDSGRFYLSRELVNVTISGNQINLEQKLYQFTDTRDFLLSTSNYDQKRILISPNPVSNSFKIKSPTPIKKIQIYTLEGKTIFSQEYASSDINISQFASGIYLLKGVLENGNSFAKKIIKN